ncbi:hypothetical protein [Corynebacterium sp. CNJ-954]|uniref:hypothetical protein n=1 Tax=Corynebacterium sp. CNJ-954 TaxID=1904962 RepID=UPI001115299D|nr:hypothetical protein [Corynebacterium sp. CNJ-954]
MTFVLGDPIGRVGGAKVTVTPKNVTITRGGGMIDVGEVTVDRRSTIVVEVSHNNTNSFSSTNAGTVVAIWPKGQERTAENCRYGPNYNPSIAALHPLEVSMSVPAGTYSIACALNASVPTTLSSYTVTSLRTVVAPE